MKHLNKPEEMKWLKALIRVLDINNEYKSAMLHGNEDCPSQVDFYRTKNPQFGDKVVRYVYDCEEDLYEKVLE
jgi:hypothetical protein